MSCTAYSANVVDAATGITEELIGHGAGGEDAEVGEEQRDELGRRVIAERVLAGDLVGQVLYDACGGLS
eukprot:CAMPEP_0198116200 /NCGR_PEP_ID=MMETSP1442-20131203/10577_1 /TAXON_ID= /ORGANISM="Craspedostauros australis, Strain CCMP3328" /LENGTH=68 /DNA_ID=CAMNT_0043773955 /DNA_START=74 /DNA_END=281 /DNA_ORIENTATION=+